MRPRVVLNGRVRPTISDRVPKVIEPIIIPAWNGMRVIELEGKGNGIELVIYGGMWGRGEERVESKGLTIVEADRIPTNVELRL